MGNPLYYAEVNLSCACDLLLVVWLYRVRAVCTFFFKFFFVLNTSNKRSKVKTRKVEQFTVKIWELIKYANRSFKRQAVERGQFHLFVVLTKAQLSTVVYQQQQYKRAEERAKK
jgi:hypothetical protein